MDGTDLHCLLKDRYNTSLPVAPSGRSVTLRSPGFDEPIPFYHNNNFCIYNVSLDCPGEIVHLSSKSTDYSLADGSTCQDYLWFDTSSDTHLSVDSKICGDAIGQFNATVNTQSFIGILWSNEKDSEGRFEIEARCSEQPVPTRGSDESSGDTTFVSFEEN